MKINCKTIFKAAIGVLLLGIALTKIDLNKTWSNLQGCDYIFLLLAASVSFGSVLWVIWVRKGLLSLLEKTLYVEMLKAFFVSNYIANFTPANIGGLLGEPWGLYSFSQGRIPVEKGLAFVILTAITQNIRRILLTLLGVVFFSSLLPKGYIGVILLAVLAYVVYSIAVLILIFPHLKMAFILKPVLLFLDRFSKTFSKKLKIFAGKVGDHFRLLLSKKKSYFILTVLVISNVVLESLRLWLLLLAFGVSFNFFSLLLIPSLAYSVTVLPISLGGLGVTEISGMIVFQSFGIAPEVAFPVVFLDRFLFTYWGFVMGAFLVPFMKVPYRLNG
ncbi:MAG: hypothetical protein B5M56_03330 [Desulfococcus sp. 4484_241]|nr:MAG: hypothetical protein B5M56_03330 [Desulfococcus sp. 4484_241]